MSGQGQRVRGSRESKEGERINLGEASLVAIVAHAGKERRTIDTLHLPRGTISVFKSKF